MSRGEFPSKQNAITTGPPASAERLKTGAMLIAVAVTVLWGTNATAQKFTLRDFPPIGSAGLRFVLTALLIGVWFRLGKARLLPQRREILWLAINGALFLAQIATFSLGVYWGTAGHSIVLLNTYPLFVLALSYFFLKERTTPGQFLGLAAALIGIIVLFAGEWSHFRGTQRLGDGVQLLSALILTGQVILLKYITSRVETRRIVFWQMASAAVFFTLYGLGWEDLGKVTFGWPGLIALMWQGIVVGPFCFSLWTWLIKHHSASRVSVFSLLTPVAGVISSALLLGEPLTAGLLFSTLLVAGGIALASLW
jgi:drug/metabolite transporter (DMT)-like permease